MRKQLYKALITQGYEVIAGKGGFWLKDHGFVTTKQAQKMTGIAPAPRQSRSISAYGDLAWVAAINRVR